MADQPVKANDKKKSPKDVVTEQLIKGIQDVMESDKFRDWCKTSGKLYYNNYSFKNAFLVYLQKQNASHVMGYGAWKEFGRQVAYNSQSIKIFTPSFAKEYKKGGFYEMIHKNLSEQFKNDPSLPLAVYRIGTTKLSFTMQRNGILGLRLDGKDVQRFDSENQCKNFINRSILGKVPVSYNVGYVFDVSDTIIPEHLWVKNGYKNNELVLNDDGEPIKNNKGEFKIINTVERQNRFIGDLDLTIPDYDKDKMKTLFEVLKEVSNKKGIPMTTEVLHEFYDGYFQTITDPNSNIKGRIVIKENASPTEQVAAALHEMAHSDLHMDIDGLSQEMGAKVSQSMAEIQAEAVAFMTASNFGITTETSSFNYIASYSKGKDLQDLQASLNHIYKESKALMNAIKDELDLRGLDLTLEPKNQVALSIDEKEEVITHYVSQMLEKSEEYNDIYTDIANDLLNTIDEEEVAVIKRQQNIVENIKGMLSDTASIIDKFTNSQDRKTQNDCIKKIDSLNDRIHALENDLNDLSLKRMEIFNEHKSSLKVQFSKKPLYVLNILKNDFPALEKLTDAEIQYLSKSKIIKKEYAPLLKDDPQLFIENCLKQLETIKSVQSKTGTFVEVNLCERWSDKEVIFEEGSVGHPKLVNKIIEQAETQIQELKEKAKYDDTYYPYHECRLSIFTKVDKDNLVGIETRVYIGDASQVNLIDHLKQVSKNKESKLILEKVISASKERVSMKNKLLPLHVENTASVSEWKSNIKSSQSQEQQAITESPNFSDHDLKQQQHNDERGN